MTIKRKQILSRVSIQCVLVLVLAGPAAAQVLYGSVAGEVLDSTGAVALAQR